MDRKCAICRKPAIYDAPTIAGPWAYLCQLDYELFGNTSLPPTVLANIKE